MTSFFAGGLGHDEMTEEGKIADFLMTSFVNGNLSMFICFIISDANLLVDYSTLTISEV